MPAFQRPDRGDRPIRFETDTPRVSYLVITRNRRESLERTIASIRKQAYPNKELVVVDCDSTDSTPCYLEKELLGPDETAILLEEDLGVCGSRDIAAQEASGEVLITIDDDAVFDDARATERVVNRLKPSPDIGALAFQIVNASDGQLQSGLFPSREDEDPNEEFETYAFVGAGHAYPRDVYKDAGPYGNYHPYGHEDLDLSFKILDEGYRIVYFPDVVVRHEGREDRRERLDGKWGINLANRVKVALHNLPAPYALSTAAAWSARTLCDCRGDPRPIGQAIGKVWSERLDIKEDRDVISEQTVDKLKRLSGPLWF
jgi:GT2 family glycosyltransferase